MKRFSSATRWPCITEQIEVGQANHHYHAMRPHLSIIKKRSQLIIKEETVVKARFVILRGVGANQRVHTATLIAGKLDFGEQHVGRYWYVMAIHKPIPVPADPARHSVFAPSVFPAVLAGKLTTLPANGEENQQDDQGNGDG